MKTFYLIITFALFGGKSSSQNILSQFYSSPLLVNPANTGRLSNDYRMGAGFRNEKNAQSQVYSQTDFFLDFKILNSVVPENESFAIGIQGISEKSLNEGIKNNYLSVSLAYQKALDVESNQQLGIGIQTTLASKRLEKPNYILENQLISWTNSGYSNIDLSQFNNVNIAYVDLNAGLMFQGKINSSISCASGISVYHITTPSKSFAGGNFDLSRQFWGHISVEKKLFSNRKIYSALLFGHSKKSINDIISGINYQIGIQKYNALEFGVWYRKSNVKGSAIIPTLGINFNAITITTSYDINTGTRQTNQRSATEITLVYNKPLSKAKYFENRFIRF